MTEPATPGSSPAAAALARAARRVNPAISWTRGITHSPRRAALAVCAVLLLVIAAAAPLSRQNVIDSVQFSLAFFATLLTGEAVIFALSFSPSSAWPSLREIDAHIAFREWVVAGWLAAMLTAIGVLTHTAIPGTYGALLFLLADVFGMFSFVRLFGLASADGRKRLLRRTLAGAISNVTAPAAGSQQRMRTDHVLNAYLGQLDEAAARSDGNGIRDLADQLATIPGTASGTASVALHLDVVHRLMKAALVGKLDPVVASGAAEVLTGSLLTRISPAPGNRTGQPDPRQAAAVMAQASRYLAWLASTSLKLSAQDVTTAAAARELVAFSLRVRTQILRLADPDPPYAAGTADLGTPLSDTVSVLAWINGFTEFHGACQAAGLYPVFEILAGTKFLGNYWDGDSVLTGLREALFTPGTAANPAAVATRQSFGKIEEFDRIWTLISVGAIATLRDVRVAHPPGLIRPEFTADPQLLGAYLRTFASHRYFSTAAQAMTALTLTIGHTGKPGDLWHQVRAATAPVGWAVPMPTIEAHQRPSACVLAIASRLAPLTAGESDHQLRTFLTGLPGQVLEATATLAARTLPELEPASPGASNAAELITTRLRVLQLVGTHRASPP
ncbi:MAG: hypothetical protein ACRDPY_14430 [Streptosporangiaceae bacterium]